MPDRRRLALHWRIIVGLVVGLVVGIAINLAWTPAVWASLGVDHPAAYLKNQQAVVPVLPEGVGAPAELAPNDPALVRLAPYQLTAEQVERFGLQTRPANAEAGLAAGTVRFIRRATETVGKLFLRALQFIAVPIVLFSLIVGASSLNDVARLGRIGGKTIGIYLCTTAVAITIGLVLANLVGPGRGFPPELRDRLAADRAQEAADRISRAEAPDVWQTLLELVPTNPFAALAQAQMLQVVVAALLIGIGLTLVPKDKARPVVAFCDGMTEVIIKIVNIVLLLAPYAVFALLVVVLADLGLDVLVALIKYVVVVVLGLALVLALVYTPLTKFGAGVGPGRFFRAIAPAQLLAFSSSSSSATLPVTMECVEQRLGVREDVTSFVIPLGATINMDGTALYQGVAAVFIAQLYGLGLDVGQQLTIVLTATLASIGTAGVPGVGMIMLVIVLKSVGIPLEGIAVILGVDRLLDMCRTTVNVTGDCAVAAVVARTEGALLSEREVEERAEAAGRGLDEHPRDASPHQYGVNLGSPSRPVEDADETR